MRKLLIMGILSFLFGTKSYAQSGGVEIIAIEEAQTHKIALQANEGVAFLNKYIGEKSTYTPNDIDHAIIQWRSAKQKNRESEEIVIQYLGSFFGSYLVQKLNLEWAYYKDSQGTDLCIVHKEISVFSFPYSAIYKAVVESRENALESVVIALTQQINEGLKDESVQGR